MLEVAHRLIRTSDCGQLARDAFGLGVVCAILFALLSVPTGS